MNRFTHEEALADDGATTLAPAASVVTVVLGAYVVYKLSELFGYHHAVFGKVGHPVRLWLQHFISKLGRFVQMAATQLPLLHPARPPSPADSSSGDSQQDTSSSAFSMLSGALGLNSGGIINKGMRGVAGALTKSYRNVPAGLGNWDNSCYQNSVIQGLASLPSLRAYLSKTTSEHGTLDMQSTSGALFDLITKLNDPEHHGQHFWIRGILKSMSTYQQQDAQEYFSKVMDALDTEVKKASKTKDDTETETDDQTEKEDEARPEQAPAVQPNPLDGLLAQRVGCVACGYTEGLSLTPFNCLTVPLKRDWASHIGECLDEYMKLEEVEGMECAKCTLLKLEKQLRPVALAKGPGPFTERLQALQEAIQDENFDDKAVINKFQMPKKFWVKSTKSRQAVVARAPKALVIHVNRSIYDEITGEQWKNNARVDYPRILDLGNWCLGSAPSNSQKVDESIEESWPRDPKQSMIGGSEAEIKTDSPFQYALKAAVTHFGDHGNGHYICYRQHPFNTVATKDTHDHPRDEEKDDGHDQNEEEEEEEKSSKHQTSEEQWWRLSDESVYEVSEHDATHQSNVFMLFYERVDPEDSMALAPVDAEAAGVKQSEPVEQRISTTAEDEEGESVSVPVDSSLGAMTFDPAAADVSLSDSTQPSPLAQPCTPSLPSEPSNTQLLTPEESEDDTLVGVLDASSTPPEEIAQQHQETRQKESFEDTEMTEAEDTADDESEGTPSTTLTSDDEDVEMEEAIVEGMKQVVSPQHHVMRTAGDAGTMGEGKRESLPMVRAT